MYIFTTKHIYTHVHKAESQCSYCTNIQSGPIHLEKNTKGHIPATIETGKRHQMKVQFMLPRMIWFHRHMCHCMAAIVAQKIIPHQKICYIGLPELLFVFHLPKFKENM